MLFRKDFQHLWDIARYRIHSPTAPLMRLHRGERPEPLPEELRRKIRNALRTTELHQYPNYGPFYEKLADLMMLPTGQICVGAGIEEFIRTLMFLCCDPGDKAVVTWPTCAMYDVYAKAFKVNLQKVLTYPGTPRSISSIIQASQGARLVFLPNPGQPVETCYEVDEVRLLAEFCHRNDIVLAIDEAHFGFGAPSAVKLIEDYDNLLVLRTFSKWLGGAAIRVGWAMGHPRVIQPLHAVRPSGEITGPSITIASVLLDHLPELMETAEAMQEGRDYTREAVRSLGLKAWGEKGFSVLIDLGNPNRAMEVAQRLAGTGIGIYVKYMLPHPVDSCILLSCGSKPFMEQFVARFKEVTNDLIVAESVGD